MRSTRGEADSKEVVEVILPYPVEIKVVQAGVLSLSEFLLRRLGREGSEPKYEVVRSGCWFFGRATTLDVRVSPLLRFTVPLDA